MFESLIFAEDPLMGHCSASLWMKEFNVKIDVECTAAMIPKWVVHRRQAKEILNDKGLLHAEHLHFGMDDCCLYFFIF